MCKLLTIEIKIKSLSSPRSVSARGFYQHRDFFTIKEILYLTEFKYP